MIIGQERTEPAGPIFSVNMSDDNFKVFLQGEGLRDGDCSKLIGLWLLELLHLQYM